MKSDKIEMWWDTEKAEVGMEWFKFGLACGAILGFISAGIIALALVFKV